MKNNIYKILFAFLCMFIMSGSVFAAGTGTGQSGISVGRAQANDGCTYSATPNGEDNFALGVRISIHKSDGTVVKGPVDYLVYSRNKYGLKPISSTAYPVSRLVSASNFEVTKSTNQVGISTLQQIFYNSGMSVSVNEAISSGNMSKTVLFGEALADRTIMENLFKNILGKSSLDEYRTDNDAYDLFLVWEPLGRLHQKCENYEDPEDGSKYNADFYVYGTARELVSYTSGKYNVATEKLLLNSFSGVITKGMGCAVNIDDDDSFGAAVAEKFPSQFNTVSYFNGKLTRDGAAELTDCINSNNLLSYAKNSSSAFAVGILWIDEEGGSGNYLTCTDVNNYYGKDKIWEALNAGLEFDFTEFNNAYHDKSFPIGASSGITTEWYKKYCYANVPQPEKYTCLVETDVPQCDSGRVYYKDTDDWANCVFTDGQLNVDVVKDSQKQCQINRKDLEIMQKECKKHPEFCEDVDKFEEEVVSNCDSNLEGFISNRYGDQAYSNTYNVNPHKFSNSSANLTYYDSNLSNKYCSVYCVESVSAYFDSSKPKVLAGYHFEWGWGNVYSSRTCKTKEIDKKTFETDLTDANVGVLNAYASDLLQEKIDAATPSWKKTGDVYGECTEWSEPDELGNKTCIGTYPDIGDKCEWTGPSDSITVTGGGLIGTSGELEGASTTVGENETCSGVTSKPTVKGTGVGNAIKHVNNVVDLMNQCQLYKDYPTLINSVLNEVSTAKISYTNTAYNYGPEDMPKSGPYYSFEESNCGVTQKFTTLTSCDDKKCSGDSTITYCDSHEATRSSESSFSVPENVYRYVLKTKEGLTLKSVHNWKEYENVRYTLNYIDIGYSNWPVAYNYFDTRFKDGLKIEYSNLGHYKSGETTDVDTILGSVYSSTYGKWYCDYTVNKNKCLVCDKGVDVIYREIDLYNPFPDIDASKRKTGANWCDGENCKWDNDVSKAAILNNRGVTGNEVYNLKPMYVFELTPSAIIQIRRYNKENEYSEYTGSLDGAYYDFKCKEGTGRQCVSEYLTKLINDYGDKKDSGVCSTAQARNTSTTSTFESCRY